MTYEVNQPILNNPFEEPQQYWFIREDYDPELRSGRRPAIVYPPRDNKTEWDLGGVLKPSTPDEFAPGYEMTLVNLLRQRVKRWRDEGYPGVTRTTLDLLHHWNRPDRGQRLFFTQREAAETIIFLTESRFDLLQGINIPLDRPVDETLKAFTRYACKMATGSGKTTVMAMLTAWSVLNKVGDRQNKKFSDVVLIVCPNVTIRSRLAELNPANGEASLYRTRDLVPAHYMDKLRQGKVIITNWHTFERRQPATAGSDPAKVVKVGVPVIKRETIKISDKNTTARGQKYVDMDTYRQRKNLGLYKVAEKGEKYDKQGNLKEVELESTQYLESEAAWIRRILETEIGGKGNILVLNDEAHHAYRIAPNTPDEDDDDEAKDYEQKESTIWVEGLDRIHKHRGINFCVDLSATPYFLNASLENSNKPFPWVVSDFSLMDAIESGLVKIPQLPVRDPSGKEISEIAYFNIWKWIMKQVEKVKKGKTGKMPKPELVLQHAIKPLELLGGEWEQTRQEWLETPDDPRPPVFIIVCKNTKIAKAVYEWIAEDIKPAYLPSCSLKALRNTETETYTIRVDSKVVEELESGNTKSAESKWLRFTLDTVGQPDWAKDDQGRSLYPDDFKELAIKLGKPLHPPGRDIRCVVSVGMLTEGWDCRTVTHIMGIRPFMSQLLCEQVVGRALRRREYELQDNETFAEETAKIFGVPFEVIPFKANPQSGKQKPQKRHHVYAIPQKSQYRIEFPRVEGYTQSVKSRVTVDWEAIAPLKIDPHKIPPEVQMKAAVVNNQGRPSIKSPGDLTTLDLNPYRKDKRQQQLIFELAKSLTQSYCRPDNPNCEAPAHVLFPQLYQICDRYLAEKVTAIKPAEKIDVYLAPYFGWVIENLNTAIHPDTESGESPELPKLERHRDNGSTDDVNFWSSKPVYDVVKSHVNCVVADTSQWEQATAYAIDNHPITEAFVKNDHLGLSIPYFYNNSERDYYPDFIIRLNTSTTQYLILETKGYVYEGTEEKAAAAIRWVKAVNADGRFGQWQYRMFNLDQVREGLDKIQTELGI